MHGTRTTPLPAPLAVGGVQIPYLDRDEVMRVVDRALGGGEPVRIAFCNANTMLRALSSPGYAQVLRRFLVLNDGLGMDLCSWLFTGRRFAENLNGTDFTPEVLGRSRADLRVFLLGGAPGTAELAGARLGALHPRHRFVGAMHGFFGEDDEAVLAAIERAAPDLLLVGMGNPRQEEFIARAGERLRVPVVMAVGAFLDFTAGNVVRAPRAVRALRAEWLFRLAQEPRRLGRRYTVDVAAFFFAIALLRVRGSAVPRRA